ncbi:BCAM0308 family protein [Burkholderia ubonensis]|uniref:BCAM0308 family protein n=1 Tax=Burkholderia ubonensis TaxID=101571 RepID=UPI000F55AB23|nr:BCAM0308 family protein [Burkholderia ubonensis]RQP27752.1 glutamyl-tRNA amidotransferase [Burkholderia ubonensis]RQP29768.1 glutamyl-tRNA amidotransferase [Burkholderia ubonensis]RQP31924.1 glutamyl-tRNA amidotransferase [Burkholderia ubonensis]RQP47867.1 glutamyl-tRNA amidotransferase [Burkholderia ubonensis]RQP50884.1 glutamyl-tRNA amidotransferase [Burkholderia ubonensis]
MNRSNTGPAHRFLRRDKRMQPHTKDSYREPKRARGDTYCETCGAVCDAGRWAWRAASGDLRQLQCPACKRTQERPPAGELVLRGAYIDAHRVVILGLLRRQADFETNEHALERIMAIDEGAGVIAIRTTGRHMVRRLAEALLHAHHGDLALHYRDGEDRLRTEWTRSVA